MTTFTDKRYTIMKEFGGYSQAKYVLRFCGDWLSAHKTAKDAERARLENANWRLFNLSLTDKQLKRFKELDNIPYNARFDDERAEYDDLIGLINND